MTAIFLPPVMKASSANWFEPGESILSRTDLRQHYQRETETLIARHREGMPAVFPPTGETIAVLRKNLVGRCIEESVRFAQGEIQLQSGVFSNQFAFILCAGALRGLSLFSDVDYVFAGAEAKADRIEGKSYFELLARKTQDILNEIGLKADNLIERFSNGKLIWLNVDDLKSGFRQIKELNSIRHALLDHEPVERAGNEEVYQRFQAQIEPWLYKKNSLKIKNWRRMYVRQYLRKNSVKGEAWPHPSVWLRDIAIFYFLAKLYLRLIIRPDEISFPLKKTLANGSSGFYHICEELEKRTLIAGSEKQRLYEAYEFFMQARNEAGLIQKGIERPLEKKTLAQLSSNLFYQSLDDFLESYRRHAQNIQASLDGLKHEIGHERWMMALITLWGAILIKAHPLLNRLFRKSAKTPMTA